MRMSGSIERLQNRVEKALSLLKSDLQVEFPLTMSRVRLVDICAMVIKRLEPFIEAREIQVEIQELSDSPAGLWDREKLEEIVEEIESKLQGGPEKEMKASKIGQFVMKRLKALDKVAYVRFASVHREFKDVLEFKEELESILKEK